MEALLYPQQNCLNRPVEVSCQQEIWKRCARSTRPPYWGTAMSSSPEGSIPTPCTHSRLRSCFISTDRGLGLESMKANELIVFKASSANNPHSPHCRGFAR